MFNNLPASRPTSEARWKTWLIVAAAHILVIYLVVILTAQPEPEPIEVIRSIILEDVAPAMPPEPSIQSDAKPVRR